MGQVSVVSGYSLEEVKGHAVVVHSSTDKVACGIIGGAAPTSFAVALDTYPGYTGSLSAAGSVSVFAQDDTTLALNFALSGLEANTTAGIHIHAGVTVRVLLASLFVCVEWVV